MVHGLGYRIAGIVTGFCALVFAVVAISSTSWLSYDGYWEDGLFRRCWWDWTLGCKQIGPEDPADSRMWFHGVRFCALFGLLLVFAAFIMAVVGTAKHGTSADRPLVSGIVMIVAGLLLLCGVIVYTAYTGDPVVGHISHYGWSFILEWIAAGLAFISGGLLVSAWDSGYYSYPADKAVLT
ncbi:PREDICTED: epithelial membrane protein 1-like [Branchiostoma belcheri]|uniref:Epithelial membrane protein 1-like n=1 Tax=Branchiostoma belcheri TaxID=7741 RepID=A0A6P4ZLY3_BRABE|nr:PREDICTED: epithelial membrane protein 1-like [Branchiostoma belcheri]KAI8517140.1 hypothetical protein Bbelb_057210 [Branchiostoma belcheri]